MPRAETFQAQTRDSYNSIIFPIGISLGFLLVQLTLAVCPPIWGSSEARESQVVWSILNSGEWILPTRNGIIPSKPPLLHWLAVIVAYVTGGVNAWSTRIVSVVSGAVIMFCSMRFASRLYSEAGKPSSPSIETAVALILGTSYLFFANATDGKVDALFSAVVTGTVFGSIYSFWETKSLKTSRWILWLGIGLSALAKGPLGPVLILVVSAVSYVFIFNRGIFLSLIKPGMAAVIGVMLALSWYVAASNIGGGRFIERQIVFENIKRFVGGESVNNEPFWFYLPSLLRTIAPWSVLSLTLLIKRYRSQSIPGSYYVGFIVTAVIVILLSLASGKRHSYLLPIAPWFSVSLALVLVETIKNLPNTSPEWRFISRFRQAMGRYWSPLSILFLVVSGIAITESMSVQRIFGGDLRILWGSLAVNSARLPLSLLICTLLSFTIFIKNKDSLRLVFLTILFFVVSLPLSLGLVVKGYFKDFEGIAARITKVTGENRILVVKEPRDEYFDPILFYLKRPVEISSTFKDCSGYILTRKSNITNLQPAPLTEFREKGAILRNDESKILSLVPCPLR